VTTAVIDPTTPVLVEPNRPKYERSPILVFSLVVAAVIVTAAVVLGIVAKETILDFHVAVLRLFAGLPDSVERFLIGLSQFAAVLLPVIVVIGLLALRQRRALLVMAVAGLVSAIAVAVVDRFVKHENPALEISRVKTSAWLLGSAFPSSPYIAAAAAGATIMRLFLGRRWGRVMWLAVAFIVAFRLFAGANVPLDIVIAVGVGWFVGTAVALVFGAPDHRPTVREVADALAGCGLPVARLAPAAVDARGSTPWFATTTDGGGLFVKALGRDERDADLLFRIYRFLRLKNVGDQRPFASLRRAVEHEALVSFKARDSGIRTPRVRNVATVGPDGMLLAYDAIEGTSIDSITEYSDDLLEQIWQQVAIMRRERIAHRDLRRANIFRGSDGELWIIDFGFSELAASDRLLRADVAELLAATAVVVGPQRAVKAAVGVLGPEAVGDSMSMLQPLALAGATHKAMAEHKGLMSGLQDEVRAQTGVTDVQLEPLARVRPRTALMLISSLIALYVLIPQLADVGGMVRQLKDANWGWVAATLGFSVISYIGASISLMGLAPTHVPAFDAFEVSLSGSFVNRITPAGVGGIGLNVRYLQKRGADTAEAASRIGVNSFLGLVIHLTLTVLFLLWAGKESSFDWRLPKMPLLVGLLVILVAAGVLFVVPWGRHHLLGPARSALRHAWTGVTSIAKEPTHLLVMIIGGTTITLSYLFGLYAAVEAFGGGLAFPAVGAVYLAGSAIGQAAPTPGGLGAVEAALIAGLVSVGLDKEIAVPSVLLFRLMTFWVPILPGWGTFARLTRRGLI
jgi:glycosyltransferase 2 family protein